METNSKLKVKTRLGNNVVCSHPEESVWSSAVVLEILDEERPLVLGVDGPADAVVVVTKAAHLQTIYQMSNMYQIFIF